MKKIKAFFYVYYKSLTTVKYYQDILKTELGFSMKYFFALAIIATLIVAVSTSVREVPKIKSAVDGVLTQSQELYPEDLVITIENGQMSTNQPDPVIISMPQVPGVQEPDPAADFDNLVVIDEEGTLGDMEKYNTLFLVNESNILVWSEGRIEVYPLRDLPNTEITRETINNLVERFEGWIRLIPYIITVLVFVALLFYYLGFRLVYLLPVALIFFIIGSIRGLKLTYGKYYQIGLHTITLPLTVEMIAVLVGIPILFPFWFFIVNILFGVLVISSLEVQKASESEKETP
jgi:hypothetical protein